jgi:hypothetical protein
MKSRSFTGESSPTIWGKYGLFDDETKFYLRVYNFRQFKLLCKAHSRQLDFMLEQIKMAPKARKNFFMYLEDYV